MPRGPMYNRRFLLLARDRSTGTVSAVTVRRSDQSQAQMKIKTDIPVAVAVL